LWGAAGKGKRGGLTQPPRKSPPPASS